MRILFLVSVLVLGTMSVNGCITWKVKHDDTKKEVKGGEESSSTRSIDSEGKVHVEIPENIPTIGGTQ